MAHLSYSPDLTPSNHHLFGSLKEGVGGKPTSNSRSIKSAVKTLKYRDIIFGEAKKHALARWWTTAAETGGD